MRHTRSEVLIFILSLLFVAGGVAGIRRGELMGWEVAGFFGLCAAVMVAAPWLRKRREKRMAQSLTIDDWGVRRTLGTGKEEALAWAELTEVMILTTADGPFAEDVFFMLRGAGDTGVLVGQELAMQHKLLDALQARLPDLDNEAIIRAMGSTEEARFVVWPPQTKQA
ncbi:MAG: hypothetical protein JWN73_4014 [Betaproteobacteria bacterium]|nr:hypothetical protein [Betaproteobacteria bacterium]